jgi:hypothetical protein
MLHHCGLRKFHCLNRTLDNADITVYWPRAALFRPLPDGRAMAMHFRKFHSTPTTRSLSLSRHTPCRIRVSVAWEDSDRAPEPAAAWLPYRMSGQ